MESKTPSGVKIVSLFDSDKPTPHFFTISTP